MSQSLNTQNLSGQEGGLAPALAAETMVCPLCPEESGPQPIANFGICRKRKTGRNLYCKTCINKKVGKSRVRVRDYHASRKKLLAAAEESGADTTFVRDAFDLRDFKRPLTQRILSAIELGHHSYENIDRAVRVVGRESEYAFGDAIAELLIWRRQIRYEGADDARMYFLREAEPVVERRDSAASFSTLGGICAPVIRGKAA